MALSFVDNISYLGKKPLDSRHIFKTIADMKNFNENYLPPLAICQNEQDGNIYTYDVSNTVDSTLGKWRILQVEDDISADADNIIVRKPDGLYAKIEESTSTEIDDMMDDVFDNIGW